MTVTPRILAPLVERNRPRSEDLLGPDQPPKPSPPIRRWRYNAGIRALIFFGIFLVLAVVTTVCASVAMFGGQAPDQASITRVTATLTHWGGPLITPSAVAAYLLLTLWWEQRRPPYEVAPRRFLGGVGSGLALGAILCTAAIGLLALFGAYTIQGVDPTYNPVWALLTVGLAAGITEEILYRGIMFRLLEDTFGTWISVAISGLVFGLTHLGNSHATLQGALAIALEAGLLFAVLYVVTRSLWVLMGLHCAWNVVQGPVFGSVVSGTATEGNGWIVSSLDGPAWLAGGGFGMEASLVTVALLVAVAIWLCLIIRENGLAVAPFWVRRRRLRELVASQAGASQGLLTDPR